MIFFLSQKMWILKFLSQCFLIFSRITNGGKSTLSQSLHQQIPNSCIVAQDSYFKVHFSVNPVWVIGTSAEKLKTLFIPQDESVVPEDSQGFKQYDSKGAEKPVITLYYCSSYQCYLFR